MFLFRNSIFERSIKRRNIKLEDPYDWELLNQRDTENEPTLDFYSDNNNRIRNGRKPELVSNNSNNNNNTGVNVAGTPNVLAACNNNNIVVTGNNENAQLLKSSTTKLSNLNLNVTNKDISLVTQMNACADDLSLKPNTADAENKRNVTQYCVS